MTHEIRQTRTPKTKNMNGGVYETILKSGNIDNQLNYYGTLNINLMKESKATHFSMVQRLHLSQIKIDNNKTIIIISMTPAVTELI